MDTRELLIVIESHLKEAGISAAEFGKLSMNDPAFVYDLRRGRRVWPETIKKVLGYLGRKAA